MLLLGVLPILLVVYLAPIEKERLYASLELDCTNRGVWMYDRLYNNNAPIDVAFIGSSHTINAIVENSIQQSANCDALNIVNLGYCRMGRNMSYVLLKELTTNKKVTSVVLEVREDEDRYSHPVFPFLAGSKDVLGASLLFNRDYIADNWDHFAYRCQLIQEKLFQFPIKKVEQSTTTGFMASADTLAIGRSIELLDRRNRTRAAQGQLSRQFYGMYPTSYLNKIAALCKRNQISLYFLYLPGYGATQALPLEMAAYKTHGKILIPPKKMLKDRHNWHDKDHFNIGGAHRLSEWLGERLECDGDFK